MGWSLFCIFDSTGNSIIRHQYRSDIKWKDCESIFEEIALKRSSEYDEPVLFKNDISTIYMAKKGIFLSLLTKMNSNCITGFSFLSNIYCLISAYTGDFSTHALLENSMLIREVLDEAMDFGYPQVTDFRLMKHYISTSEQVASYESPAPPAAVTNAVSNRPPNIFYNINEIYVDIIEELKFKQNASGVITQNEVIGSIILKIYLSGQPELKISFNNIFATLYTHSKNSKTFVNSDFKFNPCVLTKEISDGGNSLIFYPPDGKLNLMSYRVPCAHTRLFDTKVNLVNISATKIQYSVLLKTLYQTSAKADKLVLSIPVEKELDSPQFTATLGVANYHPESDTIQWTMTSVEANSTLHLNATFNRAATRGKDKASSNAILENENRGVSISFKIPFFSLSKIEVISLSVFEKSNYPVNKYISYMSKNGTVIQY